VQHTIFRLVFAAVLASGVVIGALAAEPPSDLRLNQIQVIGTHNSYHAGLTPVVAKLLRARNPGAFDSLDYAHPSLTDQLDHGVRQVELDIYADTKGGRFAHPFGAALAGPKAEPFDPEGVMLKPGFKVMHLQDIDYVSTCQPFIACLREIRAWSMAHPAHEPVFILVETKTQPPIPGVPMASPEPFTPKVLDDLDAEIRSVFQPRDIIAPDDVRGSFQTLPQALRAKGWPTLAEARGKVIFLLDQKNVTAAYVTGHPSLSGRVLFTNADPGAPDAAFVEMNDGPPDAIRALVQAGYLVRTRADADTKEARTGEVTRRDQALASGAQIVSTDYPASEPARWTGYKVALPGDAVMRCNPVTAPKGCGPSDLASGAAGTQTRPPGA